MTPGQIAYQKIKALENAPTQLPVPSPTQTVVVGSIDAQSGAFTFLVPTFKQTLRDPAGAAGRPVQLTVGTVTTNCVNLTLAFEVTNVPKANAPPEQDQARRVTGVATTGGTGDVTVSGFPSAGTQGSRILLNAGLSASAMLTAPTVTPAVETWPIGITVHGTQTFQHISIIRPPVLGMGAFTIPAFLLAIVFAPPQGTLTKNSNSFADKVVITNSTTVSASNETDTKTMLAYSASDLAGKVADVLTQIAGLITGYSSLSGGGGAAAAAASGGDSGGDTAQFANTLKEFGTGFKLFGDILSGLTDQGTSSGTTSVTVTGSNSLSIVTTFTDTYGSENTKGPPDGNRFIYLKNVLAVWSNVNGNVGLTIIDPGSPTADSGDALANDLQVLSAGNIPESGLDPASIQSMLDFDPYYVLKKLSAIQIQERPPLLGPPRFVPLSPPGATGRGTSNTGDVFSLATEVITDTSTSTASKSTTVTDAKPGWIDVLFGIDSNVETTTTITTSNTVTSDQKTDATVTNTVTMFSAGINDPYNINLYYDTFSQTIVPVDVNSQVIKGVTVVPNPG
jgi:hypothetical protein